MHLPSGLREAVWFVALALVISTAVVGFAVAVAALIV